jgi:hypothetical protein
MYDRAEDYRSDHHTDQIYEGIAQRFHGRTRRRPNSAGSDPQNDRS